MQDLNKQAPAGACDPATSHTTPISNDREQISPADVGVLASAVEGDATSPQPFGKKGDKMTAAATLPFCKSQ